MNSRYILFVTILSLFTSGCLCFPFPDEQYTYATISSETINSIVSDKSISVSERSIPDELLDFEGVTNAVDIYFKDNFCACSRNTSPKMSVTSVNKVGLVGRQIGFNYQLNIDEYEKVCSVFAEADKTITEAKTLSENHEYFHLGSYRLIWDAQVALGPLECDPVKAKSLANQAKLLARTEGAKALGLDISGTYDSEFTGEHPFIVFHNKIGNQNAPTIMLKQDGQKVTGFDSSGNKILVGVREERVIEFKFSYSQISDGEMDGVLLIDMNGINAAGTWSDPAFNTSGNWKLTRIQKKHRLESLDDKKDYLKQFLTQQDAIEINYEVIDSIDAKIKIYDPRWACVFYGAPPYVENQ